MKQQGAYTIINRVEGSFGATILLGRIWACEAKNNAMGGEECTRCTFIELTPIVCLQARNLQLKLCRNECMK
jgi:hypothetical protein